MTRILCVLLVSPGLVASAIAQESDASRALASVLPAVVATHAEGSAASAQRVLPQPGAPVLATLSALDVPTADVSAPAASAPGAASGPSAAALGQVRRIRDMLTQKFGLARAKAEQISSAVMSSASKYSLPPALVLAVISIESRFQEHARGRNGATGLMQVVPAAHKSLVKNIDLTEPVANIEAGSAILHGYLESARGDLSMALKSYGGSVAYAHKVSLRAKDFQAADAASDTGAMPSPQ